MCGIQRKTDLIFFFKFTLSRLNQMIISIDSQCYIIILASFLRSDHCYSDTDTTCFEIKRKLQNEVSQHCNLSAYTDYTLTIINVLKQTQRIFFYLYEIYLRRRTHGRTVLCDYPVNLVPPTKNQRKILTHFI